MSFSRFIILLRGEPLPFVLMYTIGNLVSLSASMFLAGPARQGRKMFDKTRRWTSVAYLTSMVATIVVCFIPMATGARVALLLVLVVVQFCSMIWYTLSYIPYGRSMAKNCVKKNCCCEEIEV